MPVKEFNGPSESSSALVHRQFLFHQDERASHTVAAEGEKQPDKRECDRKKRKPRRVHRKIFGLPKRSAWNFGAGL